MNRLLVFAVVASIGNVSAAFAEDSLLKSGARHVQQIASVESVASATTASTILAGGVVSLGKEPAPAFQAEQGTLVKSGMRKRTKLMIAIGLGVGFAASAWVIDHNVLDVTPSSLGTRQD
jgi:hypothetical protein